MADINLRDNRQSELRATCIAIVILASFFVVLRVISRRMKGIKIGSDDIMIFVALIALFMAFGACMIGIHFGLGRHTAALSTTQIVSYAKSLTAFECLYVTCVCFTKLSLLLMYRRIFPVRSIEIGSLVIGTLSVAWCIAIIMVSLFQCVPMQKIWDPTLEGHCINLKASFVGNAIPNILTDVAILALPMKQVWNLQTGVLQKAQISSVILLGSFVIFTSIYRFTTLFQFQPVDVTWTLATAEVWCVVESASGIISACLPTLGHLFQRCARMLNISLPSQAHRSADTPLQTIGGSGGPKKTIHSEHGSESSRPFGRSSISSKTADERRDWGGGINVRTTVRVHDVESIGSLGSDEMPLRKMGMNVDVE